jgi:DNA-binding CsgD family transcriptional regulator
MEKPFLDFYYSTLKIWDNALTKDEIAAEEKALSSELHKMLSNVFQTQRSYYILFNRRTPALEYINDKIDNVLGYFPNEMNITLFLESIHPEDINFFFKFEKRVTQFYNELAPEKRVNYIYHHDFRIKTKTKNYIRLLHQIVPIEFDGNRLYRTLAIHTDITHIKREGEPTLSIIGLHNEPSYYDIRDVENITKSYSLFTSREKQILSLILDSYTSNDIAKELYISLHTVNNHRKNILKKAKVKTPQDLIKKAINEGWNYKK